MPLIIKKGILWKDPAPLVKFLLLLLPPLLTSCSDLNPEAEDTAPLPPPQAEQKEEVNLETPPPPTAIDTPPPSDNPLGFLDPDTTGQLMTEAEKKTITEANAAPPSTPEIEGDNVIDVDPPKLPQTSE